MGLYGNVRVYGVVLQRACLWGCMATCVFMGLYSNAGPPGKRILIVHQVVVGKPDEVIVAYLSLLLRGGLVFVGAP